MKLIYIYFDFTDNGYNPEGYRGFKKCGFNFGTKEYFKMEEPTSEEPYYTLTCVPRPKDEQIEPGFWGDERLYNISALVGDNGVGKSTIIQEIIRCVIENFKKDFNGFVRDEDIFQNYRHCVSLWQNEDGTYKAHNATGYTLVGKGFKFFKNIPMLLPMSKVSFLNNIKFVYFSNVLSGSDAQLLADFDRSDFRVPYNRDTSTYYTHPLYNCSLSADIAQAVKVSYDGIENYNPHIGDIYDTYFNFRSYQEARFLFDRNQRSQLLDLQEKYQFPVPVPRLLKLNIAPALIRINTILDRELSPESYISDGRPDVDHLSEANLFSLRQELHKKSTDNYRKLRALYYYMEDLVSALCMNCIASLYISSGNVYFPEIESFTGNDSSSYKNLLDAILNVNKEKKLDDEVCEYYRQYFDFLWNNKEIIEQYFHIIMRSRSGYIVQIYLDREIDVVLTEFMIQFINFTRAVSNQEYFVTYNWGLSSGESNLLHIFTKLRYLLYGNSFDCEFDTEKITKEKAENASLAQRKEYLTNNPEEQQKCDSVILFFDEADLTLHPEWQRQFVSILAAYLPMLYKYPYYEGSEPSGCKDIQIILSTHSPIMLGDFPSASVIYLKKDKDKDKNVITVNDQSTLHTFGQNIYTILKEGFYLGEGTVGELARQKIKAVMKDLGDLQNPNTRNSKTLDKWISCLETHQKQTIRHLPKGLIRNKLEEEIAKCRLILGLEAEGLDPDFKLLMMANEKLLEENKRLQEQLAELKNKGAEL